MLHKQHFFQLVVLDKDTEMKDYIQCRLWNWQYVMHSLTPVLHDSRKWKFQLQGHRYFNCMAWCKMLTLDRPINRGRCGPFVWISTHNLFDLSFKQFIKKIFNAHYKFDFGYSTKNVILIKKVDRFFDQSSMYMKPMSATIMFYDLIVTLINL